MGLSATTAAPIIHSSTGASYADITKLDHTLSQEDLDKFSNKVKIKEAEKLDFRAPAVGTLTMADWQYDIIVKVVASSSCPHVVQKWIQAAFDMSVEDKDLEDPDELLQLSLKGCYCGRCHRTY